MRHAGYLAAILPLLSGAAAAADCGTSDHRRIEGARYTLAFRSDPAPIEAARPFSLDVSVCGRGKVRAPALVRVGAWMPEHGHGMNYATVVTARGEGRWRVDGLMFHMPGRWELTFDLGTDRRTERLTAEEDVE